jgi:hypothetical protein
MKNILFEDFKGGENENLCEKNLEIKKWIKC